MKSTYETIVDGEGVEVPANELFRFACCGCGLVHDVVIATGRARKTPLGLAMRQNKRATTARRAEMKRNAVNQRMAESAGVKAS